MLLFAGGASQAVLTSLAYEITFFVNKIKKKSYLSVRLTLLLANFKSVEYWITGMIMQC